MGWTLVWRDQGADRHPTIHRTDTPQFTGQTAQNTEPSGSMSAAFTQGNLDANKTV